MSYNTTADLAAGSDLRGAEQQSFLGCTIKSFSVSAGFGDSASNLTVKLVVDPSFTSDGQPLGEGVDVYHDGVGDRFRPPPVGTPVFFTFGKLRATVAQGFARTIDDYYGTSAATSYAGGKTVWDDEGKYVSGNKGYYNFSFAGLLQSYHQTKSAENALEYTVTITDPRELLSNAVLILNNYNGTTFSNANMINVHGFLEHNAYDDILRQENDPESSYKKEYKRVLDEDGYGMDVFFGDEYPSKDVNFSVYKDQLEDFHGGHPMTGTGMSRRTSSGIPYYRVMQALNYLSGTTHKEYDKYKGNLYFRGLGYSFDLSDLPILPKSYMLDYDSLSILDFCQEVCEVANYELFFALLPFAPGLGNNQGNAPVAVIKLVVTNKNVQAEPGAVRGYLDDLPDDLDTTSEEFGYELTNEPTDKFVTGGKECSVYYFPTPYGGKEFGMHIYSSNKPIIPFYGFLSPNVPTIPRGYGSYSQILLDASSLNAYGVGRYYVATEIELRAASVSFEKWCEFLLLYNSVFMESIEGDDISDLYYAYNSKGGGRDVEISRNYAITVPRCVWPPHPEEDGFKLENGVREPKNPCSPPYGWPLYWHRALNIGLPRAGAAGVSAMSAQIIEQGSNIANEQVKNLGARSTGTGDQGEQPESASTAGTVDGENFAVFNVRNAILGSALSAKLGKTGLANAKIIYNFLKKIADECLGKKYLVQIPQRANLQWSENTITATEKNNFVGVGPYGFPPRDSGAIGGFSINGIKYIILGGGNNLLDEYYKNAYKPPWGSAGGLTANFNKPARRVDYNYKPSTAGGYYGYYGTPTLKQRREFVLEPIDNAFIKGNDGRLTCYARFSNSYAMSLANFPKGSYSIQYLNSTSNTYVPKLGAGIAIKEETRDEFKDSVSQNGENFIPQNQVSFVKCEIDEKFYAAPPVTVVSTSLHGNEYKSKKLNLGSRKIYNCTKCKEVETFAPIVTKYEPEPLPNTPETVNISTIDLSALWRGDYHYLDTGDFRNGVYALITLPERAVPTQNSAFRDGMNMQVNAASIQHYLQKDVVRGMPGFRNQSASTVGKSAMSHMWDVEDTEDAAAPYKDGDPIGLEFRKSAQQAVRKAYQGLTFDLTSRINIISPSPIVPDLIAIPLESQERNYGPWTSLYEAYGVIGGKMEYIHDENLTPWSYGGYELMDRAGRVKSEFGTSANLMSEKGAFSFNSWPSGLTIGAALDGFGPLVSDITISMGAEGVQTSVTMNTYTQSFGKLQKQREDQLRKLTREKQRVQDINNSLIRRDLGKSQDGASFAAAVNGLKHLIASQDFSKRNYNRYERGEDENADTLMQGACSFPTSWQQSRGGDDLSNEDNDVRHHGSMGSQGSYNHMCGIMSESPTQAANLYQNTATMNINDMYAATAAGFHQTLSVNPLIRTLNNSSYGDSYGDQDTSSFDPVC